jgi:hypothetical protein
MNHLRGSCKHTDLKYILKDALSTTFEVHVNTVIWSIYMRKHINNV